MYRLTETKAKGLHIIEDTNLSAGANALRLKKVDYDEDEYYYVFSYSEVPSEFRYNRGRKQPVIICDPNSYKTLGRIYQTTIMFKKTVSSLYVPNKFLNNTEAMNFIGEFINKESFDLYIGRCGDVFRYYISIDDYVMSKFGFNNTDNFDIKLNEEMLNSTDSEQRELARIFILTSNHNQLEKRILLDKKLDVAKLSNKEFNSLCPEMKTYVKDKIIKRMSESYRNIIARFGIQIM